MTNPNTSSRWSRTDPGDAVGAMYRVTRNGKFVAFIRARDIGYEGLYAVMRDALHPASRNSFARAGMTAAEDKAQRWEAFSVIPRATRGHTLAPFRFFPEHANGAGG